MQYYYPDWNHQIGVPIVGDDIIIGNNYVITANASRPNNSGFRIAAQPTSKDGKLGTRANVIIALLNENNIKTVNLLNSYFQRNPPSPQVIDVELKNILENHRTLLEHTAHYMASFCSPTPREEKVQFPIAKITDTKEVFSKKFDKWFPNLASNNPEVKNYLMSLQHFSGESWLAEFSDITNQHKHRLPPEQGIQSFEEIVITFENIHLRIGNLGINSITLGPDARYRFEGTTGNEAFINGSCKLSLKNLNTKTFDNSITVKKELRERLSFSTLPYSIEHMIWLFSKNIYQTVNRICALLS